MKIYLPILALAILALAACTSSSDKERNQPDIIPKPKQVEMKSGHFKITGSTDILIHSSDPASALAAEALNARISAFTGQDLEIKHSSGKQPRNSILLRTDETMEDELGKEGYKLSVKSSAVEITASTPVGLFYGMQTVLQLLPPDIWGEPGNPDMKTVVLKIPCLEIVDVPSFSWRGMHLDVSRHFFPKEFVKRYIDMIAMHKMNVFHWHLTNDNGWRIEIDQYPLLTEVSAWRADRDGIPWDERQPQRPGEKATYGGFYTKEDIREIIGYADKRFVTIIPEIEMPGHSSEVFAAYPQYSCSGERRTVQTGSYWPNTDIFCAGKDETFRFIENILDEVTTLFPSKYIHIGGDEADKTAWRSCRDCQARIREEGLSGEDELQSYFVKRIEKYLTSKGKKMIGWDEILEGGLAPEATVMSWRGFEGGIEAALQGHEVVMCPTSNCYFDYYQADPDFQPPAIGGLITLKKVYSFRPVPSELQGESRKLILGGQGNLWTEYISTPEHAEYMALPRMTALAEVLWSPEDKLSWDDFLKRLQTQFVRFDRLGYNYSKGSGKVEAVAVIDPEDKSYAVKLQTEVPGVTIYYTLDGTSPTDKSFMYKNPFKLNHEVTLKAVAYKNGEKLERFAQYKISPGLGAGKPITYNEIYSERYPAGGNNALTDGLRASRNYNDGYWQGFNGKNMDVVLELGPDFVLNSVSATFLLDQKKWIFVPDTVKYYVSENGQDFQRIAALTHSLDLKSEQVMTNDFSMKLKKPLKVSYLRVEAVNMGTCPDWHPGKGQKAWIFTDEIIVK